MPLICPICWCRLDESGATKECVALSCGHVFHQDCVLPWLEQQSTCAQCRAPMRNLATDLSKVYFAATDCTESDELAYIQQQLDRARREKEEAKEATRQAVEHIAELRTKRKESESYAEALLQDLVEHQRELTQTRTRLRESLRDQKELSLRLSEAEQLSDLYERRLQQIQKPQEEHQSSPPMLRYQSFVQKTETTQEPVRKRQQPVPRPRTQRQSIAAVADESSVSVSDSAVSPESAVSVDLIPEPQLPAEDSKPTQSHTLAGTSTYTCILDMTFESMI